MEAVLPPPPPFSFVNNLENVTSGNLSKEWEKWRKAFMVYHEACELSKKSAKVQTSILLHVIGEQCREVYAQFDKETFETVTALLDKFQSFFSPKKNITIERHRFFTRCQKQGESIEQYAFELKKLASGCEFKDLLEDLIRDRLICGIQENALRERLLREADLTLTKSLEICNLAQMSKLQAGAIKKESSEHDAYNYNISASDQDHIILEDEGSMHGQVNWISRRGGYRARGRGRGWSQSAPRPAPFRRNGTPAQTAVSSRVMRPQHQQNTSYSANKLGVQCFKCGLTHGVDMRCPAFGKMCLNCNRLNHFSRMCNASIYDVEAVEPSDQVIYSFNESRSDWSIELAFGEDLVKFKLDTGADVNVLPLRYLSQIGVSEQQLLRTCVRLKAYSGNDINVIGECHLKVRYKQNFYILKFIVADVSSPPVLGRDSCCELNVIKLVLGINGTQNYDYIFHEYQDVFEGLGCMPGEYKIEIDNSARPVVHAPRKLPVALKDSIKKKLDDMVEEGIIAKVEGPTDWVNSMTVARKANDPEIPDEQLLGATELEPEPEEIQWTDTSYTSASFESIPPAPVEEVKKKPKKKKKGAVEEDVVEEVVVEFQWSAESLPVVEEEDKKFAEEQEVETKKKGKGKKGKRGPAEEIPAFEKPKDWKKMSKKDREAWMAARIEEWRAEKEAEKQAILAGAKEKKLRLARERQELLEKDTAEQEIRKDLLAKTCVLYHKFEKEKLDYENQLQLNAEWLQYLRCDGLPDPGVPTQMNTYLHVWQNTNACDADELEKRSEEALPMMLMLEEMVANPEHFTPLRLQSYNEVRLQLREQLSETIQCACFTILRDLHKNLTFESIKLATYHREFKGLKLNIWVAVRMPTRKKKPVEPEPEPVQLDFPALNVSVKLPKSIDGSCVCMRAAHSEVDLLSESTRSYALALEPPNRYTDLFGFMVKEHEEMLKIKTEQDETRTAFYKEVNAKIRELEHFLKVNQYTKNEKEKEELDKLNMAEPPFMEDPRTLIALNAEAEFKKYLKKCIPRTRTGEVNLRKYRICGGTLNLDLLIVPPQPKRLRNDVYLATLEIPKRLKAMKYQVQYRAPGPPPPGVTRSPEEIEAEMKKVEAEFEKLALVFIQLPADIMWSEPPVVCQWQESRKLWTTNYINDYKFNEDKLTLQFRTGVLWPIGIATSRYSNMPYQGWDIRPDPDGSGVQLTVTGACVTVTWIFVGNAVKLKWIANATTGALKEHFGKKYTVNRMVQLMRVAACDFFPDFDGHNHMEEGTTCPKEWVVERHTYHAMAMLSRAYNFQWSRWNVGAGSRNLVMQLREAVDKKREGKFNLLYVNPKEATILKCNELSTELSLEPMVGLGYYPDLFTLNMSYGSADARRATFNAKFKIVENVYCMLVELKLLSFS